jgi:hypothetical protein
MLLSCGVPCNRARGCVAWRTMAFSSIFVTAGIVGPSRAENDQRWRPFPASGIRSLVGPDFRFYEDWPAAKIPV